MSAKHIIFNRINRKDFFISQVALFFLLNLIILASLAIAMSIFEPTSGIIYIFLIGLIASPFLIAFLVFEFSLVERRLHDLNSTGIFAYLIMVTAFLLPPLFFVILLLLSVLPGNSGPNIFGEPVTNYPSLSSKIAGKTKIRSLETSLTS